MITEEMIKRESRQYDCKVIHGLRLERKGADDRLSAKIDFTLKRIDRIIRLSVNYKSGYLWNRITPDF